MQQLLGGPRSSLTEQQVIDTLAITYGTNVRHGVDVFTASGSEVADADLRVLPGGDVTWGYRPPFDPSDVRNEEAEVRRTATLMVGATSLSVEALRYRLWTETQAPDATWVRFNSGWFLSTNPPIEDDGRVVRRTLKLADKTFGYRRELTDAVAPAPGTVVLDFVADRLDSIFGETTVAFPASTVTLDEGLVFRPPTTELAMMNALLQLAGCDALTTDEDLGRPRTVLLSELAGRGPEHTYGPGAGKIKVAGAVEPLLERTPNVVRFVARQGPSLASEGNGIITVRNQSTGPASIDQRGDEVTQRVDVDAQDQAELEEIAAADAQRYFAGGGLRYTGKVGLNPRHGDRDVIAMSKPRFAAAGVNLDGTWLVTEWRLARGRLSGQGAALMDITLEKRV